MNVLSYVILTIISVICGQCARHLEKNLIPLCQEKINYKQFLKNIKIDFKVDIKFTVIFMILFNLLYFVNGNILSTYIFIALSVILVIVFSIDYKVQLIPDEVHIYILVLAIINIIFNKDNILDYVFGSLIGGGIFFTIAYGSYFILKKEGMGLGDAKLMTVLGLLLGVKNILVVTLLSFLIGAIIGITLLLIKKKDKESYIPFGPFIVISVVIIMFVKTDYIIDLYISFCSMLGTGITDVIYYFIEK